MASITDLLRGTDREYFDLFDRAGANAVRAAELLSDMLATFPDRRELARDIVVCEHEGDTLTHEVIRRLNQTFVTPIDREDVLELVSSLDDIVDYTEEVADYPGAVPDRGADAPGPGAGPACCATRPARSRRRSG